MKPFVLESWTKMRLRQKRARTFVELSGVNAWLRGGGIELMATFETAEQASQILTDAGYKQTGNIFRP